MDAIQAKLETLQTSSVVRNGWSAQIDIISVTKLDKPEQTPELRVVGIISTDRGVETHVLKGIQRELILAEALTYGKSAGALYHNMMS